MKTVRLIKRDHLPERRPTTADTPSATINQAVKAVRTWVQERRDTQQQQARQMFAALFTQPQS
jgi:hypothetical protein